MAKQLKTASDVIDALGGITATARLMGADPRAVWNWRRRGLPAETYVILKAACIARGLDASDALWGMREAAVLAQGGTNGST